MPNGCNECGERRACKSANAKGELAEWDPATGSGAHFSVLRAAANSTRVDEEVLKWPRINRANRQRREAQLRHMLAVSEGQNRVNQARKVVEEILQNEDKSPEELAQDLAKANALVQILEARLM